MFRFVAIVAALALPASAAALPTWTPRETPLQRAMRIADAYWPDSPCERVTVTVIDMAPGTFAYATLDGSCAVVVNRRTIRDETPAALCMVMVHEYGHLDGMGHSADPRNVMFAAPSVPPKVCRRHGR